MLRRHVVSCFSVEVKYRGVVSVVVEVAWICNLLLEIHCPLHRATVIFCDNVSIVCLASNLKYQRTKHVEIDLHFVRERVALVI